MVKKILAFAIFMIVLHGAMGQSLFVQEGQASFYADKYEGRPTASGEKYRHNKLTAAHRSLPFGTVVRVTNLKNKKKVDVKAVQNVPPPKARK